MRFVALVLWLAVSLHAATYDLLVQGALDVELGPLLAALQNKKEVRVETWTFWTGRIGKQKVVISRTDVGSINAVASTVLGIQKFRPKRIINQGTAGGHSRRVKLWDIVIGEKTTDYAAFKTEHAEEGAGVHPEKWQPRGHAFRFDPAKPTDHLNFAGDPYLMEKAEKVPYSKGKVYRGNVGTAFQYNRELDYLKAMNKIFGTDSEDMESAYAAGAAAAHKVPFLAIRIISDTEWEHPRFERIAGQYCAEFVRDLILALP
ncbi:MAG: 5'-methylthioadenosine/S-adenosylhomocysteine nucleosidase [Bryobacterales bacterium]|nr:5'-methylthioadenosine/S-adenosylhomocysteine nucleosidase [Bryobacterales bacterium]